VDRWELLRISVAAVIASVWIASVVGHMIYPQRVDIPYTVQIAMAAVVGWLFALPSKREKDSDEGQDH
jgi:hypothetical protein